MGGKILMEDWKYIVNEVKLIVNAASGADVRIVFPDTPQITEDIKHTFNQHIMQGMAGSKNSDNEDDAITPGDDEGVDNAKNDKNIENKEKQINNKHHRRRLSKLKCSFDDESSDDEDSKSSSTADEPGSTIKSKKQRRASTMSTKKKKVTFSPNDDDKSVLKRRFGANSYSNDRADSIIHPKPRFFASKSCKTESITNSKPRSKSKSYNDDKENKGKNKQRRGSTMSALQKNKMLKNQKFSKKKDDDDDEEESDSESSLVSPKLDKDGKSDKFDDDMDTEDESDSESENVITSKNRKNGD